MLQWGKTTIKINQKSIKTELFPLILVLSLLLITWILNKKIPFLIGGLQRTTTVQKSF